MKPKWRGVVALVVAGCALVGCGKRESRTAGGQTNAPASQANPITAPVDYVGAVGRAQQHSAKVLDLAQVTQAIQQFHAAEDRYPKELDELVKEGYLAKLPALPAGMRYEYNAATGQAKVVRTTQP